MNMLAAASDSDAETVMTEGMVEGGKGDKEKREMGKVSQITVMSPAPSAQAEPLMFSTGYVFFSECFRPVVLHAVFGERIVSVPKTQYFPTTIVYFQRRTISRVGFGFSGSFASV